MTVAVNTKATGGGARIGGPFTWATLPSAAAYAGEIVRVSDVGKATVGSLWISDGTRWVPLNGAVVLKTLDAAGSNIANTEAVAFQHLIPAGMLAVGDRLRITASMTKSGAVDSGVLYLHLGPLGTTADAVISSDTVMSAGARSFGGINDVRVNTATQVQRVGASSVSYSGATSNTTATTTVSSVASNALYFSVGIASSGATNTVSLLDAMLELITSGN